MCGDVGACSGYTLCCVALHCAVLGFTRSLDLRELVIFYFFGGDGVGIVGEAVEVGLIC